MSIAETEQAGPLRYLVVDTPNSRLFLDEDDLPRLIAAIRDCEENGPKWFIFEHLDGRIIHLRLVTIEHFGVSTPETRAKFAEIEREQRESERQSKPWGNDD
jgi:hypothetical protein